MRKAAAALVFLLIWAAPRPSEAWGFEGHKYIMAAVLPRLPAPIRTFFIANRTTIVEHAIDPDLWRTAGWEQESPRHFVDMDAYGPPPFAAMPQVEAEAVARYGRQFVDKNGTLPWRTEEIYKKLVEAFTLKAAYSRDNIKFFSSIICHYVADAHVPFHAALNYDGQLTGQWGIHSRFESELFDRTRRRLRISPTPPQPVPDVRALIFATLTRSFALVQPILDADKAAVAGRDTYDDAYFAAFGRTAAPILDQRVADSIADTVSVITAAWVEAGRLPVPVTAKRRQPASVRRQ